MDTANLEKIASLPAADRITKLGPGIQVVIILSGLAAIAAFTVLTKPSAKIEDVPSLEKQIEQLQQENRRLEQALQEKGGDSQTDDGTTTRLDGAPPHRTIREPDPRADNVTTPVVFRPPFAQASGAGNQINIAQIVWLAVIALTVLYVIAIVMVFFSKRPEIIQFAMDTIKTLTGFYIGIVLGALGFTA